MEIVTADLYDAHHQTVGVCALQFRSFGKKRAFFGPCATVATFEDHTPVLEALSGPGDGRVLVVDGQGSLRIGLMGDRLAGIGVKNGWAGVVVNGAIRDSLGIDALDIGVKALGATPRRGWSAGPSMLDIPLGFGGVVFTPGAWIYADVDGVLVSPAELSPAPEPAPLRSEDKSK